MPRLNHSSSSGCCKTLATSFFPILQFRVQLWVYLVILLPWFLFWYAIDSQRAAKIEYIPAFPLQHGLDRGVINNGQSSSVESGDGKAWIGINNAQQGPSASPSSQAMVPASRDVVADVLETMGITPSSENAGQGSSIPPQNHVPPSGDVVPRDSMEMIEHYKALCNARHAGRLIYSTMKEGFNHNFFVSVHAPEDDAVISQSIITQSTYGSIDEMQGVCEHGQNAVGRSYTIDCGDGKLFVEAGSALGHVSMYAARRGMRVIAIDPLEVNIQRTRESMCMNGMAFCESHRGEGARVTGGNNETVNLGCFNDTSWGSFSTDRVQVHNNLVGSAVDLDPKLVRSQPQNLAATAGGTGVVASSVTTVSVDSLVAPEQGVELMLLTCQGFELEALKGAVEHITKHLVRNVIVRLHAPEFGPDAVRKNMAIIAFLNLHQYEFYRIDQTREDATIPPKHFGHLDEVMLYVQEKRPPHSHPNILASLSV